jgi:hypothetical protein
VQVFAQPSDSVRQLQGKEEKSHHGRLSVFVHFFVAMSRFYKVERESLEFMSSSDHHRFKGFGIFAAYGNRRKISKQKLFQASWEV